MVTTSVAGAMFPAPVGMMMRIASLQAAWSQYEEARDRGQCDKKLIHGMEK